MYWVVILSSALLKPAPPISPGSTTSISAGSASGGAGSSICGSSSSLAKTSYSSPPSPSPYSLSDIPLVRLGGVRPRTGLRCVGVAAQGWLLSTGWLLKTGQVGGVWRTVLSIPPYTLWLPLFRQTPYERNAARLRAVPNLGMYEEECWSVEVTECCLHFFCYRYQRELVDTQPCRAEQ